MAQQKQSPHVQYKQDAVEARNLLNVLELCWQCVYHHDTSRTFKCMANCPYASQKRWRIRVRASSLTNGLGNEPLYFGICV